MYWIYQRDILGGGKPAPVVREEQSANPSFTPGNRLGGSLNPFVTDTDIDAPPQRPQVPSIPGR